MTPLQIAALAVVAIGAIVNYSAGAIVDKTGMAARVRVPANTALEGQDLERYRNDRAKVQVKMAAFVVVLIGAAATFYLFR